MRLLSFDVKSVMLGLVVGAGLMLVHAAYSAAPAPAAPAEPRFQISAHEAGGGESIIYVLDHSTDKVYYYRGANNNFGGRQEAFQLQR